MRTYGMLDVALAGFYAWLGFALVPSRSPAFNALLVTVIAVLFVSGVALLLRLRWARAAGVAASSLLLILAAVIILGLVASSAYVRGLYGPLGRGVSVLALCAAALAVEVFALVPLFQLRFLLRKK